VTRHPGIVFRALSWNLFHGRDSTHAGLRRSLFEEFVAVLAREEWDVALLQEAPPRWFDSLRARLGVEGAMVLTSRNFGSAARGWVADRRPDLIKSNEGGSNQLLVRPPWGIESTRQLTLARFPERRRALWARLERDPSGFAVVNLHASSNRPRAAASELLRAAEWAGDGPLLFGGDFNVRPVQDPALFDELRDRFGLAPTTAPDAIDHLLARDLEVLEPPHRLAPERRELDAGEGRRIRLSDHAPVAGTFAVR
jgi:endonuclease/exonuclease/phosphatase family metal-dependent hydrolase